MLQRQIVIKALGKQIDIEDPAYTKYGIIDFHSIGWMFIAVSVTIYRNANAAVLQRYENNCCIITTKLLRSCI
jgi:hypothetical protein